MSPESAPTRAARNPRRPLRRSRALSVGWAGLSRLMRWPARRGRRRGFLPLHPESGASIVRSMPRCTRCSLDFSRERFSSHFARRAPHSTQADQHVAKTWPKPGQRCPKLSTLVRLVPSFGHILISLGGTRRPSRKTLPEEISEHVLRHFPASARQPIRRRVIRP